MRKTLLLVDGSSYLYRAYHAMAQLSAPVRCADGCALRRIEHVAPAAGGLCARYCAVVFDAKGKNFRHEMFPDYKATRPSDAG